nr:hypothetical protein [Cylindrospermopsis raciborskii]
MLRNRIYIYPVGLLGFVPQPNLRLPTTKLVGFKPTFALRPVSPTNSLQVASPLRSRVASASQSPVGSAMRSPIGSASRSPVGNAMQSPFSGGVGFHASTQPTFIFRCLD